MPSEIFQHLSDADMKALIAYLRSLQAGGQELPPPQFSIQDKQGHRRGRSTSPPRQLVRETRDVFPFDPGPQHALGRYITEVTCAECHGPEARRCTQREARQPPDLVVAGGYSRAEFETLMTKGIPSGGRKLKTR